MKSKDRILENKPILVTGIHRSGTTFVGKMLAQSDDVIYLWEPFQAGLKSYNSEGVFDFWYEYLSDDTKKQAYLSYLYRYTQVSAGDFRLIRSRRKGNVYFHAKNLRKKLQNQFRLKDYRLLLKDPIAVFSASWLSEINNDMKVIVMKRNPVSFINSLVSLNWDIGFDQIQSQKKLMEWLPEELSEEVKDICSGSNAGIIEKGILFWNIVYTRVLHYKENYTDWQFIHLERLSNEPEIFRKMFDYCELAYTNRIANSIERHLKERSGVMLNSSNSAGCSLSTKDIHSIITGTSNIANQIGYQDLGSNTYTL